MCYHNSLLNRSGNDVAKEEPSDFLGVASATLTSFLSFSGRRGPPSIKGSSTRQPPSVVIQATREPLLLQHLLICKSLIKVDSRHAGAPCSLSWASIQNNDQHIVPRQGSTRLSLDRSACSLKFYPLPSSSLDWTRQLLELSSYSAPRRNS